MIPIIPEDGLLPHVVVIDDHSVLPRHTIKGHYRQTNDGEKWMPSKLVPNFRSLWRVAPHNRWRIVVRDKTRGWATFYLLPPNHLRMIRSDGELRDALREVFPTVEMRKTVWMISGNDLITLALLERP